MYCKQNCLKGAHAGAEHRGDRMRRIRLKTMHTPRELMALVSYLRQQEAKVIDTMQQLLDVS